jgi:hypothetical protein
MHRSRLNFLIDALAFAAFVFLTTTGILMRYLLPPGSGRWALLWGLGRHDWGEVHFWIAVILFGLLTLHLVLHWRWVLSMVRGQRPEASGMRAALGLVGVLGLLALAAAPLLAPVEQIGTPAKRGHAVAPPGTQMVPAHPGAAPPDVATPRPAAPRTHPDTTGGEDIRGSMTLREAAESAGLPVETLLQRLALPAGTDPDERIGRLRRLFSVGPDEVRAAVRDLNAERQP